MRWIKSSQRLPDSYDAHEKHVRLNGKKVGGIFIEGPYGGLVFEYREPLGGYKIIKDLSNVEWLDESESPVSPQILVDALRQIKDWNFTTDGRKFNGDHKEVMKIVIAIASEAMDKFKQAGDGQDQDELALEAMDFYWRHFVEQLKKPYLGDVERKQYEGLERKLFNKIQAIK